MYFIYKSIIKKYLLNRDGSVNSWAIKRLKENNPLIYKRIELIFDHSLNENMFILVNGYKGVCKICFKPVSFQSFKIGYKHYCSAKCSYKSEDRLKKMQRTSLSIYGYKNPSSAASVKEKRKHTFDKKYGGIGSSSITIIEKMIKTNLEKYGVDNGALIGKSKWIKYKNDLKSMVDNGLTKAEILKKINYEVHDLTLGRYINQYFDGRSSGEKELKFFLNDYNTIYNSRKIMDNEYELDLYFPDFNLAIEYNGIYWHGELMGTKRNYHLSKTEKANEKNIQLIQIFETEWNEKQEIVKSIINSKFGKYERRIFARTCQIEEIPSHMKNHFLEENHLQGSDKSSIKLGLFYHDELISVMTFGKSRYNKKYEYEMHRYCSKKGYQIVCGASKLLTYFIRKYSPKSIITYADRRFSNGQFYKKIGFELIGVSKPNYFYFIDRGINRGKLIPRLQFQKHKLKNKLEYFDESKSEWENMQLNGYDRIWDCGNFVYAICT